MYNTDNNGFTLSKVAVPADGSCFFSSVSIAMYDSIQKWGNSARMRRYFKHHWSRYAQIFPGADEEMSPKFIRYMAASAMDKEGLLMHNEEAKILKRKQFDTPEEFARCILHTNCWADQAIIRSFMKSLHYTVCVVVVDEESRQTVYMPPEWTRRKEFYLCVCLDGEHYTPINVEYKGEKVEMCMNRDELKNMLESCDIKNSNEY